MQMSLLFKEISASFRFNFRNRCKFQFKSRYKQRNWKRNFCQLHCSECGVVFRTFGVKQFVIKQDLAYFLYKIYSCMSCMALHTQRVQLPQTSGAPHLSPWQKFTCFTKFASFKVLSLLYKCGLDIQTWIGTFVQMCYWYIC